MINSSRTDRMEQDKERHEKEQEQEYEQEIEIPTNRVIKQADEGNE